MRVNRAINPIVIQERDLKLLRGLLEARVMSSAHVATIYFDGKREAAKKRIQKLKASGIVGERRQRVFEPALLHLAPKGAGILRDRGILAEYPALTALALEKRGRVSDLTIRHELEVMDVKAAFHATLRKEGVLSTAEFTTWPRLHQFETSSGNHGAPDIIVRPDGFIRIHEKKAGGRLSEHAFYLEVDRSTETQDVLVSRAHGYLSYYKSGGFAVKNGATRSEFKDHPFRVLMVFKTAERRNNMAERLLRSSPPILTLVHLSTLDEVRADPLGAVWIRPLDYRDATRGTPFDPDRRADGWEYRRQAAREEFVEATARRQRLLPGVM